MDTHHCTGGIGLLTSIPEWNHSLLLTTLKGSSLRVLKLNTKGTLILSEKIYLTNVFGRLRDICIAPNGDVYISTSNRDWNPGEGFPKPGDDRIIRLHKEKTVHGKNAPTQVSLAITSKPITGGASVYTTYCASCHKADGNGLKTVFPPLRNSVVVNGNSDKLIRILLKGRSGSMQIKGETYNQQMPAFTFLRDKDLADVLTYIRLHFDNHGSSINAKQVATVRSVK
jgi:cytochrome c553